MGKNDTLFTKGPDRVMISETESRETSEALGKMGVTVDVIFIRDDGWTLGAPARLADVAYKLWQKKWVSFVPFGETTPWPIEKYEGQRGVLDMIARLTPEYPDPPEPAEEHLAYLDKVKAGGTINMMDAAPLLEDRFGLDRGAARYVLRRWIETYAERKA